jgi:hypothetical protein
MNAVSLAIALAVMLSPQSAQPPAQRPAPRAPADPAAGAWRGTIRTGPDAPATPLVVSIVKRGDAYAGAINVGGANEIPLSRVSVAEGRVTLESRADSKMGAIALTAELTLDANKATGVGTLLVGSLPASVLIELQRQPRADVLQPVSEQRAAYFVGRWTFEYLGGEFPPLSPGSRAGTATITATSQDAIAGTIEGTVDGKPYREQWSMTFDPATQMLAVVERRAGGPELLSVANWQTPLAIRFTTAPVHEGGHAYQLRRLLRVISESSFSITEEFSVDGGPFRRLGQASFEKSR